MSLPTDNIKMKSTCQHHEECMKMVQLILDGEASPEQVEHFKAHNLQECMPCIESYKLQNEIKASLQTKVEKKCCPESVASNIAETIKLKLGILGAIILVGQVTLVAKYWCEIRSIF